MQIKNYSFFIALLFGFLFGSKKMNLSEPVVSIYSQNDASGRIFLFMLSHDGYVSYLRQENKNSSDWGTLKIIGENVKLTTSKPGDPVILRPSPIFRPSFKEFSSSRNSQERIVVIGLNSYGKLYYSIQNRFEPENWSEWKLLPGPSLTQIAAIQNNTGSLMLIGLTTAGNVLYCVESYDPLDPKKFGEWKSLNALNLDQIVCEKTHSGKIVVFAKNKIFGSVYYNWQTQPGLDNWSGWKPLDGTELKSIAVNRNPDGRFTLLSVGGDLRLYERYQLIPEGQWVDWTTHNGSNIKQIVSCKNKKGQMHVFALHLDGTIDVIWQLGPGGNNWSGWFTFGGNKFRELVSGQYEDGRLILFAVDAGLNVQYKCQLMPDGDWDNWKLLY